MWLFSIIMFLAAAPTFGLSIAIYKGKTNLIHDYHQTNVTDKTAYGKAFGKAMSVVAAALMCSGIAGLFPNSGFIPIAVLTIGIIVGLAAIIAVQHKYNGGLF